MGALIKKDFLLLKKQLIFEAIFCAVIIPFLSFRIGMGSLGSAIVYIVVEFVIIITNSTALSTKEVENKKVLTYFCATPLKKITIGAEKYVFDIIIMVLYNIIYFIEVFIFDFLEGIDIVVLGLTLIIVILYRGIFIPLEWKFGFEKVKFYSIFVIFAVAFGIPLIVKNIDLTKFNFLFLNETYKWLAFCAFIVLAFVVWFISIKVSVKIIRNKEL